MNILETILSPTVTRYSLVENVSNELHDACSYTKKRIKLSISLTRNQEVTGACCVLTWRLTCLTSFMPVCQFPADLFVRGIKGRYRAWKQTRDKRSAETLKLKVQSLCHCSAFSLPPRAAPAEVSFSCACLTDWARNYMVCAHTATTNNKICNIFNSCFKSFMTKKNWVYSRVLQTDTDGFWLQGICWQK